MFVESIMIAVFSSLHLLFSPFLFAAAAV